MNAIRWIALCTILCAVGCGKKGDPRAPELATPETIRNLSARQEPRGVLLQWSRPTHYVDGNEIRDLVGFVIFRKDISLGCIDCPTPYRTLRNVNIEDQDKFVKQKQFRFVDDQVEAKMIYRYRVASELKDGSLSAPSNEAEIIRGP